MLQLALFPGSKPQLVTAKVGQSHTESGPHYCIPLYRYSCHKHTLQASTLTTLQYCLFSFTLIRCLLPECVPVQNFSEVQLRRERVKIYLCSA